MHTPPLESPHDAASIFDRYIVPDFDFFEDEYDQPSEDDDYNSLNEEHLYIGPWRVESAERSNWLDSSPVPSPRDSVVILPLSQSINPS